MLHGTWFLGAVHKGILYEAGMKHMAFKLGNLGEFNEGIFYKDGQVVEKSQRILQ